MAMTAQEIEDLIRAEFPDADITIKDLRGDGNHYAAEVVDASFQVKIGFNSKDPFTPRSKVKWMARMANCTRSP